MLYPHAWIWFSAVLVFSFIGFAPTYFLELGSASAVRHFHGITALMWVLMLISQSWAISHGKVSLHRTVGKLSYALAPLFIASGFLIIQAMIAGAGRFRDMFGSGVAFADMVAIATFAWLYYSAIRNRRNMQLHARYMTATVLLLLMPVFTRVISFYILPDNFPFNFHFSNGMAVTAVLILLFRDRKTVGVTPPFLVTGIAVLVQGAGFELLNTAGWWKAVLTPLSEIPTIIVLAAGLVTGTLVSLAAANQWRMRC